MFRVGQKVVCIKTPIPALDASGYGDEIYPTKGEVYTVRDTTMIETRSEGDIPAIRVHEIKNLIRPYARIGTIEPRWPSRNFRPAIERKTDTGMAIIKKLLQPKSERVE